jgi:hypothetical protein
MFSPQPLGKWETAPQKLTFNVKNPVEALGKKPSFVTLSSYLNPIS